MATAAACETSFERTFACAAVGLALIAPDGRFLRVNRKLADLLGYSEAELLATDVHALTHAEDRARTRGAMRRLLARETESDAIEARYTRKDGRQVWALSTASLVWQGVGADSILCVVQDITDRKRTEVAGPQAEAASLAKSAFLANMSHEIRTPMNAILGLSHLLAADLAHDARSSDTLAKIGEAANHLLDIFNDVLDLARIEAGTLALESVEFSPLALFDQVQGQVSESIRAKGLAFRSDASGLPPVLVGDPSRLRQSLLNYLDNAVKFTERGSIEMRARMFEEHDDRLRVRFEVIDTGVGVPAETQARLFAPFEQADVSASRAHQGSGLGLAITGGLARLMGGEAGVWSRPGSGSTFWFTARLRKPVDALAPTAPARKRSVIEGELARRHAGAEILVAEDNEVNRDVARLLLGKAGLVVEAARDGREAVAMARAKHYALVLMDVQMPNMDGLEATGEIRDLPGWAETPIVALTANAFLEDRQRCLEAGMNDHLAKPVDPAGLYECLLRWLAVRIPVGIG